MKFLLFFFISFNIYALEIFPKLNLKEVSAKNQDLKSKIVIIAYGNECPILRKHSPYLKSLAEEFKNQDVSFVLINAVNGLDDKTLLDELNSYDLKIDLYRDSEPSTLKTLNFKMLSEVVLLNKSDRSILYQGSLNDQLTFDLTKPKADRHYLKDAILQSLKNKPVKVKKTPVFGCEISY